MTQFTSSQLRSLRNASTGIKRVTKQLEGLVYDIAYHIVEMSPAGTNVITVAGHNIAISELYPTNQKGSSFHYLVDVKTNTVFDTTWAYSSSFWASHELSDTGMFDSPEEYHKPTKEKIKWFIEHLGKILEGFTNLWEKESKEKIGLIESLKEKITSL